nr:MAG TPA: hypothetical protein [Caudoviricetes sp.]
MVAKQIREEIVNRLKNCDEVNYVSLYRGLFGRPIPDNASTAEYRNEILARIIDLCDVSEKEE